VGAGRSALPPTCCTVRKRVLEPGERGPGVETPTPARVSPPPSAAARSRHGLDGADGRSDGTGPAAAPRACCALRVFATGRGWSHTHRHHAGPAPRPRLHGASPDRPLPHTGGTASMASAAAAAAALPCTFRARPSCSGTAFTAYRPPGPPSRRREHADPQNSPPPPPTAIFLYRLQPCTKSRRRAGLGLSAHSWYRARVNDQSSPPPGRAGVDFAFCTLSVTDHVSILGSR
jgi:hypothetical protein